MQLDIFSQIKQIEESNFEDEIEDKPGSSKQVRCDFIGSLKKRRDSV
jgi:hypothetical protein